MNLHQFIGYRMQAGWRGLRGQPVDEWRLAFDADGFTLFHESFRSFLAKTETQMHIPWGCVKRVTAGKADNFTWDTIWLAFELADGVTCTVPEEAVGWEQLLEALPRHLPTAPNKAAWWPGVVHPAFAPNITQLYPASV